MGSRPWQHSRTSVIRPTSTTVRHRLIALILRLTQSSGTASKEGVRVELTKTHQDLAAEPGTVRELVSRNLSRLQAEGFLEVDGRRIIVKDLNGLRHQQTSSERAHDNSLKQCLACFNAKLRRFSIAMKRVDLQKVCCRPDL
jgi:Crp-like helix-turn-helix domain